jgi:hypothetical protein
MFAHADYNEIALPYADVRRFSRAILQPRKNPGARHDQPPCDGR